MQLESPLTKTFTHSLILIISEKTLLSLSLCLQGCRILTKGADIQQVHAWFLQPFLHLGVACKPHSLTTLQVFDICLFLNLCSLGDLKRVPRFASTTWHCFSTLIQAVPDPQSALEAVVQAPLFTDTWTQICTSICRMVHICTSICTTTPSREYFSKCCTCLIAGQRQSLGESLLLPK